MAGLGHGSGPMWVALGADQSPCGRSWERIRANVGGLGRGSGPKLAVLATISAGKWPKPEQEGDQDRDQAGKWPFLEREQDPRRVLTPEASEPSEHSYGFFL